MFPLLILVLQPLASAVLVNYHVAVKTSGCWFCGTGSDIYITFIGRDGKEVAAPEPLDNYYNNFKSGGTDWFIVRNLPRIWYLKCIKLTISGDDKFKFEFVTVRQDVDAEDTKFINRRDTWMSSNPEEGSSELRSCLSECDEYLPVRNSKWALEKVEYDLEAGKLIEYTPEKVGEQHIDNKQGSGEQSTSFMVEETVTETSYFSHSAYVSITMGTQFSAGVPFVSDGQIYMDVSAGYDYAWGEENSVENKMAATYNCVAPAGKVVTCRALLYKTRIEVPYIQVWKQKWRDCRQEVKGVFEEEAAVKLRLDITEE
ncbi:uncharacterized protein LOC134823337 [Bolinopsis microptera]|uniref:uncharacterized protein LOC134823337 n=1 Tax=Bolinopsis microptera TaxID=2820187 RepID=UPI003079FE09